MFRLSSCSSFILLQYRDYNMPYKEPQGGSRGRTGSPMISIRKSDSIGINASAMEEYFDGVENLKLSFDPENNHLAFVDDEDGLSLSKNNGSGVLNPTSFLKKHRLTVDITTQYTPEIDDDPEWEEDASDKPDEVVYVDLDNPIGTYGSRGDDSEESSDTDESESESSEEDSE